MTPTDQETTAPEGAPRQELDVRPILRAGGEPFGEIMAAVESLPAGSVLRLESTFEPTPLHAVLGGQGFANHCEELAPDHFVTEYWRSDEAAAPAAAPAPVAADPSGPDEEVLDVRGLTPPQPMERTLAALDELPTGRRLRQINERVPMFLLPLLDERGYTYEIDDSGPDVQVLIWRES